MISSAGQVHSACLLVLIVGLTGQVAAQGEAQEAAETKAKAVAEFRRRRIEELVVIVNDEKLADTDRPRVVRAIVELGEMKAVEATCVLAEKLDFHVEKDGELKTRREIPDFEQIYPAIKALIGIGKPALPAIVDAVALRERSDCFLSNALYTIRIIMDKPKQDYTSREEAIRTTILETAEKYKKGAERLERFAAMIPKPKKEPGETPAQTPAPQPGK